MTRKTGNRPGGRWLINAEYDAPEFNLLAAVVHKAVRDVQHGRDADRADALAYFNSRNFETDCACLNLNPTHILDLLRRETSRIQRPQDDAIDRRPEPRRRTEIENI